jgi:HlyD family secretion protein
MLESPPTRAKKAEASSAGRPEPNPRGASRPRPVASEAELALESPELSPGASPAGESLARALAAVEGKRAWAKRLAVMAAVLVVAGGAVAWRIKTRPPPPPRYVVASISNGDIVESVQSTGTVQPVTQVQVGAQISGRIAKVYVDFNSLVKKGDVLADIDPTLLGATVEQNRAQLAAAKAQLARAQASLASAQVALDRAERLRTENLASQADVDTARGQRDVSQADVNANQAQITQTEAQLNYARSNLSYARIFAPVDGLVVSRNIDPGQTVAASFTAPVLFLIAQDMSKMRVLAEIDEADVGKLKEGLVAEATVDAFPGEIFHGTVDQVRYNPNSVQGVVTYSAVISIDNPDMKLRPGMTATVTVKTREAHGVRRIPNAALRFKPAAPSGPEGKTEPTAIDPGLPVGKKRLYVLEDATPGKEHIAAKIVDIGISDGVTSELRSQDIPDGTKVVTDETDDGENNKRHGPRLF